MSETPTLSLSSIVSLTPGYRYQWEPVQNSHVLLYPEGMVQLNDTASAILAHFASDKTEVAQAVTRLEEEFGEADLSADVLEFLAEASERGWIHIE